MHLHRSSTATAACLAPSKEIVYHMQWMNEMFERNLPLYLAHDLEAWKKGVEEKSRRRVTKIDMP